MYNKIAHPISTPAYLYCLREQHATAVAGLSLFVHGGFGTREGNEVDQCLNDLHMLDTGTLTWTELTVTGLIPLPRSWHTLNEVDDKLYLFGGFNEDNEEDYCNSMEILDLATRVWTKPTINGVIPQVKHYVVVFLLGEAAHEWKQFSAIIVVVRCLCTLRRSFCL